MRAPQSNITLEDKEVMEKLLSAGHIGHKYAIRLQTVLLRAEGKGTCEISEFLGIHQSAVGLYINRYNTLGINSLSRDKTRKPGKKSISREIKNKIYKLVCNEKPVGETHWSCRSIAKKVGIGHTSVNTILKESGLKPHMVNKKNYSADPNFEEKLKDVVGLHMNPPENAIILCIDEKSQIQALERSQPVLPIIRNVPERQSVDYLRHGTTTLFAALDVLNGNVIAECNPTHPLKILFGF